MNAEAEAAEGDVQDDEAHLFLAEALAAMGKPKEAVDELTAYISRPEHPQTSRSTARSAPW